VRFCPVLICAVRPFGWATLPPDWLALLPVPLRAASRVPEDLSGDSDRVGEACPEDFPEPALLGATLVFRPGDLSRLGAWLLLLDPLDAVSFPRVGDLRRLSVGDLSRLGAWLCRTDPPEDVAIRYYFLILGRCCPAKDSCSVKKFLGVQENFRARFLPRDRGPQTEDSNSGRGEHLYVTMVCGQHECIHVMCAQVHTNTYTHLLTYPHRTSSERANVDPLLQLQGAHAGAPEKRPLR